MGVSGLTVGGQPVSGFLRSLMGLGMSDVHFIVTDEKWQHLKRKSGKASPSVLRGLEAMQRAVGGTWGCRTEYSGS